MYHILQIILIILINYMKSDTELKKKATKSHPLDLVNNIKNIKNIHCQSNNVTIENNINLFNNKNDQDNIKVKNRSSSGNSKFNFINNNDIIFSNSQKNKSFNNNEKLINVSSSQETLNNFENSEKIKKRFHISNDEQLLAIEKASVQYSDNFEFGINHIKNLGEGEILVTNYSIYLNNFSNIELDFERLHFPNLFINKFDKFEDKIDRNKIHIEIFLKDLRFYRIKINDLKNSKFYENIIKYIFPLNINNIYSIQKSSKILNKNNLDLIVFSMKNEFTRQGIYEKQSETLLNIPIFSLYNNEYLIPTYPNSLLIANDCDDLLPSFIDCFTNKRFPILTYFNSKKSSALWISGHYTGQLSINNKYYSYINITNSVVNNELMEQYLQKMQMNNNYKIYVVDLNQKSKNNQFLYLKNIDPDIKFYDLDNFSKIKFKYSKMMLLEKYLDNKKYFCTLENIGWFESLSSLLKTSLEIVLKINVN